MDGYARVSTDAKTAALTAAGTVKVYSWYRRRKTATEA